MKKILVLILTLAMIFTNSMAISAEELTNDEKLEILTKFAPRIWMDENERYFPSSVEWMFPYVERYIPSGKNNYWLKSKETLSSPSDRLSYFNGNLDSAKIYSYWVDKENGVTDITYWVFYPYNRGKSVIDTIWGNHVGDWEHISIRLNESYEPVQIYLPSHNFGELYSWNEIQKVENTHPIVYSAWGSHGHWKDPGVHTYKDLWILGKLQDITSAGTAWDTWNSVEAYDYKQKEGLSGQDWPLWMYDDFTYTVPGMDPSDPASGAIYRWGNEADGCDFEFIAGECRLNNGPSGVVNRSIFTTPDLK
ncbi:Vps62-related protein [Chengkuizengella sp. SCS-71B]|uniref:Vps62-related protein n=1 Tax=Chengkuizengella sp. SCS-71B TaxID=3115290 RepID=UPI0032C24A59